MEGCLLESTVRNLTRGAIMKEREEKPGQSIKEQKDSGEGGGGQQGDHSARKVGRRQK